ncbi:MAG: Holliday junction branch migration protein RuvA [Pseudomonadota bacterium]
MIGRLTGILAEKQPPLLLIDVNGVGYDVEAPMSTFYKLPETGETVTLHTHLQVREDSHHLFGFADDTERRFFRALLKVNGVGAKMALAILSGIEPEAFVQCINASDTGRLTRLPGVGKKTAERLVIEMRDRLDEWKGDAPMGSASVAGEKRVRVASASEDAISALVSLGYKPQEASRWVHQVEEEGLSSEELIRRALQAAM